MRGWRTATLVLATVLLAAALLAAFVYGNRKDLRWLWAPDAAGGRRTVAAPPPREEGPPVPTPVASGAPEARTLSVAGLRVLKPTLDPDLAAAARPALESLDTDLLDAVKDLKDRTGLFPTEADRIAVTPVSARGADFREAFRVDLTPQGAVVSLAVEPIALRYWSAREALSAALAVAILSQEVPQYAKAPSWLRYGVGLELSGFGEDFARREVMASEAAPPLMVRPLADAGDSSWACGYWAVHALASRRGDGAVKAWMEALRASPWETALAGAGETPEAFESAYRTWTSAYLRDLCANRQVLADAVTLLRQQRDREASVALEAFVESHPLDLYAGNARYFLNYARYRLREYERATEGFTDLLMNAPHTTSWQGKAHYFLGRAYQLSGYGPLAEREFRLAALSTESVLLPKLAERRLKEVR